MPYGLPSLVGEGGGNPEVTGGEYGEATLLPYPLLLSSLLLLLLLLCPVVVFSSGLGKLGGGDGLDTGISTRMQMGHRRYGWKNQ